jgi:hypothetical protein
MALTREQILGRKLGRETVTLSDGGEVVVRGLNRNEAIVLQQEREGIAGRDNYLIATGLVDPVMSEEDVAAWAESGAAGDLVDVSRAINRLSGLAAASGKEATKSFPGRRRAGR